LYHHLVCMMNKEQSSLLMNRNCLGPLRCCNPQIQSNTIPVIDPLPG
jgi:hypothetical protein